MINLNCSYQTISLTNRTKQVNPRNYVVNFGNRENDLGVIDGIVKDANKKSTGGYALVRIIKLGEFYKQYPTEVTNAINKIIKFHIADDLKLKYYDSQSIINQVCKTIEKHNMIELQDILKKIAVYKFR